ncbi:MAG: gamma-glutamylcyclotransferase [Calditerrivibrio sp.]|nr:gamma-glutamylcyclotransferase [Calditerrivibrio sp.]
MTFNKPVFIDKFFLYGTLKSDGPFYKLFSHFVLKNEPAYTYGTLGVRKGYPTFFVEGNYKVYGELVTVFNVRDVIEFLEPQYNDKVNTIIDVYKEGESDPIKAYCFVCTKGIKGVQILESGIWDNKNVNYREIV